MPTTYVNANMTKQYDRADEIYVVVPKYVYIIEQPLMLEGYLLPHCVRLNVTRLIDLIRQLDYELIFTGFYL